MASLSEITDGRLTEFKRVLANAGLDTDLVEAINRKPEMATPWVGWLRERLDMEVNPYIGERTNPAYGYPEGYKTKGPSAQVKVLQKLYPSLDASKAVDVAYSITVRGSELHQVVPKLSAIAKLNGIEDPYGAGYGKCLEIMLSHINSSRKFHNYREGRLTEKHVRLLVSTREALEQLERETPGDYLVIPMQSGKLYAGFSVRNARWEIERNGQWAMPAWVVGHHLLTHPKRCVKWEELEPDCAGDEYSPGADGRFEGALCLCFVGGGLRFDGGWIDVAHGRYGSASAFLRE